jgi:hypothetical protein
LARIATDSANRSSVHTISPTLGEIRNEPPEELLELEEPPDDAAKMRLPSIYLST